MTFDNYCLVLSVMFHAMFSKGSELLHGPKLDEHCIYSCRKLAYTCGHIYVFRQKADEHWIFVI